MLICAREWLSRKKMIIVMGDGVLEFAGVCSWIDKMTKLSEVKASVVSDPLWPHGLYSPWNSSGLNTGMDSHSLLQGIFPTQKFNQGLPHCRWIFYQLSHQGSPNMFEWVAYSFSSRSSLPGIKPESPALQADPLPAELPGKQAILTQFCFIDWAKLISITLRISGLLS